jgi:hypothetical protein
MRSRMIDFSSFSNASATGELALCRADLLDLSVRDVERVEDLGLGNLVGAGLDHQDRILGARDHEVEVRALGLLRACAGGAAGDQILFGVDDEVAVDLADAHRADGRREGNVGDHHGGRGAVHREDVVRVLVVHRKRDRDELCVIAPVLREQRAQRPVDHARGQRRLLAGASLALEERAGDLAGRVHPLLDVDGEREKINVAEISRDCGRKHHRVALTDDHGSRRLLGHAAGLQRNLATRDRHGDPRGGITTHIPLPSCSARSLGGPVSDSSFRTTRA